MLEITILWFLATLSLMIPPVQSFGQSQSRHKFKRSNWPTYIHGGGHVFVGVEEGGETWWWRRRLWEWEEEMLRECRLLLSDIVLHVSITGRWNWRLDNNGGYYVCSVYHMLTADDRHVMDTISKLIWHIHVLVKVSLLAWRLLRNRLPTKSNLLARGIISHEAQMCVAGCGEVETAQHLFVSCTIF